MAPFDPPFSGYIQPPGVPPDPTGDCWRGPPGPQGPPGPAGSADGTNTTVIATGSTTPRLLPDRFADWLNVKDFGAVHDGVTDNLAAFNATRAAALLNGTIQVPRGQLKFPNGISAGIATPVLWQTDGTTFPGGTAPIVTIGMPGDVTEGFFNGNKYFGKRSALKGPGATLRVDMLQTDTTGGNINDICGGVSVVTSQSLGNANSVWGIALVGDNFADASSGGMVGIQSTVRKHAGGDCWAIQTVTLDDTGLASSANGHGFVGAEIAVRTHGLDDASNAESYGGVGIRNAIHLTLNRSNILPGNTNPDDLTSFAHGIWVSGDSAATKTYVGSVYAVGMSMDTYSVFDARGAGAPFGYTDPVAAVRMLAGQIVDFNGGPALNSAAGNYLQYTTSGTPRLRYMDATLERWAVSDNGGISIPTSLPPNVRFYGATLDGVGFDNTAYNNARSATGTNGSISVPYGQQRLSVNPIGGPTSQVLWVMDGTYIGTAGANPVLGIGTDVVENFFGGNKYFGRSNSFAAVGPVLRVDSTVNHTGGTAGAVISTLRVNTTTSSTAVETCFGISSVVTDSRGVGNAMALAAYTVRNTARPNNLSYGLNTYVTDTTGLASSVAGSGCGAEIDIIANGLDDGGLAGPFGVPAGAGVRTVLQAVGDAYDDGLADCEIGWGVRVNPSQNKSNVVFKRMYSCIGRFNKAAFSTEFAVPDNANAHAILLASGHRIAFDTAGTRTVSYDSTSGKLFFAVSGVNKFSIDASGNMRCAGTVTGSVTP